MLTLALWGLVRTAEHVRMRLRGLGFGAHKPAAKIYVRLWTDVRNFLLKHAFFKGCCGARQLPYREDMREADFATFAGNQASQKAVEAVDDVIGATGMTSSELPSSVHNMHTCGMCAC